MIYYFDQEVNWQHPKTDIDKKVRDEINKIKDQYFSENSLKQVKLVYPKGAPEKVHRVFGVLKKFAIELQSSDGVWRYSRARKDNKGEYKDHHVFVTHSTLYHEKDIEFIWFLKNKAYAVASGKLYIENLEEEAKQEVDTLSSDADIKYMLMGKHSPISQNEKLVREVAEIFGVPDVEKIGSNQVKLNLYNTILEGEKMQDSFTNFENFEAMTEGNSKRKAAFHARRSINDNLVGYNNRDRAWYVKEGSKFTEKLVSIRPQDVPDRKEIFIQEIVNNPNIRSRLFMAIGEEEGTTIEELRELDRHTLLKKAGDLGFKTSNQDKKEELVKKICQKLDIEYKPESA